MDVKRRLEKLENTRTAHIVKQIETEIVCSSSEPPVTNAEIDLAETEFVKKHGRRGLITIDFVKEITSAVLDDKYIELPHSLKLKQLRMNRINGRKRKTSIKPDNLK